MRWVGSFACTLLLTMVASGCLDAPDSKKASAPTMESSAAPAKTTALLLHPEDRPTPPTKPSQPLVIPRKGDWAAGVSATEARYNFHGSGHPGILYPDNATGVVIEVHWTPSTQLSDEMYVQIRDGGGKAMGTKSGPSPLRFELPDKDVTGDRMAAYMYAGGTVGAFVQQTYTSWYALFLDLPFDPDYEMPLPKQ